MRSLSLCAALVFAGACQGSKDIRPTTDRSGEIPIDALDAVFREGSTGWHDLVVESTIKRPPVPNDLVCDWGEHTGPSSAPPAVYFVDPKIPSEKRVHRTAQFDPSVLGSVANVGKQLPVVMFVFPVEVDRDHASRAFENRDGQLREIPLPASSAEGESILWVSRLCERENEIAVEADGSWEGFIVLLRRSGTRWVVVAIRETWVT